MAAALLFVLSVLLAQGGAPAPPASPAADAGRRAYERHKCASCHMIAGEGNIRFKLDHVASRLSETDLRRWLTDTAGMERALPTQPAIRMSEWLASNRKIGDADRDAIVAYLATLK